MAAADHNSPQDWVSDLPFERIGWVRRILKAAIVNPFANRFPAPALKATLAALRSELAAANRTDPGGWRSMVVSYDGGPKRFADKLLVVLGTMPMALRNRRRLGGRVIARLIDTAGREPVHVLCLGAGPGHIITDALCECRCKAHATLVDLSSEAFEYGRRLAAEKGTLDRVRFIQGDVRDVARMIDPPPDIVKMLGICEYLHDEMIVDIARTVAAVMRPGAAMVFNSLSKAHGTNRFFRRVLGLRMIHRSPERLQHLMRSAGFGDFVALPEPLGVYHVIIGRRNAVVT